MGETSYGLALIGPGIAMGGCRMGNTGIITFSDLYRNASVPTGETLRIDLSHPLV